MFVSSFDQMKKLNNVTYGLQFDPRLLVNKSLEVEMIFCCIDYLGFPVN